MSRALMLVAAFVSLSLLAAWSLLPHSHNVSDPASLPVAQLPLLSVGNADVELGTAETEPDFFNKYFLEFAHARLLASYTPKENVDGKPVPSGPLIEVHLIPLIAYQDVQMTPEGRVLAPASSDHLVLVVERLTNDRLLDAKVVGFRRLHKMSAPIVTMAIVAAQRRHQDNEQIYIVTSESAQQGLKIRIDTISRDSSNPNVLQELTTKPSTEWPNSLRTVATTQTQIPAVTVSPPYHEISQPSVAVVEDDGSQLEMSVRTHSFQQGDVLYKQRYSIETNKWSMTSVCPPDPPWRLEPDSTKVLAMLPLKHVHSEGELKAQSQCVALVEQFYRYLPSVGGVHRAYWVVECSPDRALEDALVLGVIHPECPRPLHLAEFCVHNATLVFHPELDQYFVVASGSMEMSPKLRAYQVDRAKLLAGQSIELAADDKKWPAQMEPICELPLKEYVSLRMEEVSASSKERGEDISLVVMTHSAANFSGSRRDIHRYTFSNRKWTTESLGVVRPDFNQWR